MTWFHTHVVMPFTEPDRYFGLPGRLRTIRRFEHLPEKEQRKEQEIRLRRLLQHAYDTVPYYRQVFDHAGFRATDARVDRALPLPVLTRNHLRTHAKSLLSTACRPENLRQAISSGGSSPVRFRRDIDGIRDKVALKIKLDALCGFNPGDSVMMLWGGHRDLAMEPNWRWRMYEEVLMRRALTPSGTVAPQILERFRLRFEKERPKVLYGYSSVLAAFAAYLREHGRKHRPQVIIATAEPLSDKSRHLIASVFGVTPSVAYGSRDIGIIGAECAEHEGLHFHPWGSYVEFDPICESPDGTVYRLLATDLLNYGQPFIRYDTGDCVTLAHQSCSCGRWFPLISKVVGRVPEGSALPSSSSAQVVVIGRRMTKSAHDTWPLPEGQILRQRPRLLAMRSETKRDGLSA
ncbi:MAG: hypothetical protein WA708_04115 [Acidobacteriaceae bacterium]